MYGALQRDVCAYKGMVIRRDMFIGMVIEVHPSTLP